MPSRVAFEKGWRNEQVTYPYWIIPSVHEKFTGDLLTIIVLLPGGMTGGDIVVCKVQKGNVITLVTKLPQFLEHPDNLSSCQINLSGERKFGVKHRRTLAHSLAVRIAKNNTKDGLLLNNMVINLPFEVEDKFYEDDDYAGQDLIGATSGEVVLVLTVMKCRPELDLADLSRLNIRKVALPGSPPLVNTLPPIPSTPASTSNVSIDPKSSEKTSGIISRLFG